MSRRRAAAEPAAASLAVAQASSRSASPPVAPATRAAAAAARAAAPLPESPGVAPPGARRKRSRSGAARRVEPAGGAGDVIALDARGLQRHEWAERAAAAFNAAHAATGVWPAAVHVRGAALPAALEPLTRPGLWSLVADRCSSETVVTAHDLTARFELRVPLPAWAALCRRRASADAPLPPPPPGVAPALWATLAAGQHALYVSAFETQAELPEVATAFNGIAGAVCLLRHAPGSHENVGPILMAADAGADSGWHRDGTRLRGEPFRGGDVNAFHWHLTGRKRWLLYPPRVSEDVAAAMRTAPRNAFGNLVMPTETAAALAAAGVPPPAVLESRGGDVVMLGKRVWHTVETVEASVSLASDRLLSDQLAALSAIMERFDGYPLMPAKWAVRAAAASLSAAVLHGAAPAAPADAAVTRSVLTECAALLDAQMALERSAADGDDAHPAAAHVWERAPPACVSCERPHACARYCHACGTEIFNSLFECADEDCPLERCPPCNRSARAKEQKRRGERGGGDGCAHAVTNAVLLHFRQPDYDAMRARLQLAIERLAPAGLRAD